VLLKGAYDCTILFNAILNGKTAKEKQTKQFETRKSWIKLQKQEDIHL